jgi:large-conductance mechanosensitive channel
LDHSYNLKKLQEKLFHNYNETFIKWNDFITEIFEINIFVQLLFYLVEHLQNVNNKTFLSFFSFLSSVSSAF